MASLFRTGSVVPLSKIPVTLQCAICGEKDISANLQLKVTIMSQEWSNSTTVGLIRSPLLQVQLRLEACTLEDIILCSRSPQCLESSLAALTIILRHITAWVNGSDLALDDDAPTVA